MNAPGNPLPQRRYRRRILGWGAVGVIGLFAGGAAIFEPRVEDDLEGRVVEVLNDAEIGPVTASFSGQDGTLRCLEGPVAIPSDVFDRAADLWGVVSLDIDDSCRTTPPSDRGAGADADADAGASTSAVVTELASTQSAETSEPSTSAAADLDTVASIVANDSQFSTLRGVLSDSGLDVTLDGAGPFTLFAPTNEAFQLLGPDTIAELGRDTDLLTTVLSGHVTNGNLTSTDLVDGDIAMLDGSSVSVSVGDAVMLASGATNATVVEADLVADNGVVHAIDQVLVPDSVAIGVDPNEPLLTALVVDGQIILRGAVDSEAQRAELIDAAGLSIDPANVIDELVVQDGSLSPEADVAGFTNLLSAMAPNLISGEAVLTGSGISLTGVYATDEQNVALTGVAGEGVDVDLTERGDATDDDATALEADLNALVAANPITFDPSSTTISAESAAILDRVAALANRLGGVTIEIQGHTDTDGQASTNQQLSEGRAAAVSAALVERGIAADSLATAGFGGTQPIVDAAGVEDKAASRRVEFVVTVQ